jgi:hypothetical protein
MGNTSRASTRRKGFLAISFLALAFLLLLIKPNTQWTEFLLLALLTALAFICGGQIILKHSQKVLRAIRLARRERMLFKAAAEGSQGVFCICKPLCDSSGASPTPIARSKISSAKIVPKSSATPAPPSSPKLPACTSWAPGPASPPPVFPSTST